MAISDIARTETREVFLRLAVCLVDAFTRQPQASGDLRVRLNGSQGSFTAQRKAKTAVFYFGDVPPGAYTVEIRSNERTPFYLAADIPVQLPLIDPLWPAFPEIRLADRRRRLDDPAQPAAYRAQRALATLLPSVAYPFPADATLIRGTVRADGNRLAAARVRDIAREFAYPTAADGEFVLFFDRPVADRSVTLRATRPAGGDLERRLTLHREMTVIQDFEFPA